MYIFFAAFPRNVEKPSAVNVMSRLAYSGLDKDARAVSNVGGEAI